MEWARHDFWRFHVWWEVFAYEKELLANYLSRAPSSSNGGGLEKWR